MAAEEEKSPFTTEELGRAATQEQVEFQQSQLQYLLKRCGDLRVNLNRALDENEALRAELTRLSKAQKRTTPRKTASKKKK